tara:strand:- start:296 stop:760 length:465 start_codon:yes stop_codon:yes gene_type:complete
MENENYYRKLFKKEHDSLIGKGGNIQNVMTEDCFARVIKKYKIMKNNYSKFELEVKALSNKSDFKENRDNLEDIRVSSYSTFLDLLKLGSEIMPAIYVSEEIFKISTTTPLVQSEIVILIMKSRSLNAIMDEQKFNKQLTLTDGGKKSLSKEIH